MSPEVWQVSGKDTVYEGDLEALKLVASKGYLKPCDKVRCQGEDWIEARQVPELQTIFFENGSLQVASEELALPAPPSVDPAEPPVQEIFRPPPQGFAPKPYSPETVQTVLNTHPVCHAHCQETAAYVCTNCDTFFCRACIKLVAIPQIGVCSHCGELCLPFAEMKRKVLRWVDQQAPLGLHDLKLAVVYPFQDILTIVVLSFVYSFFLILDPYTLTFFPYLGILGFLIGNVFMFACVSLVIKRVSDGNLEGRNLFDLSEFLSDPVQAFLPGLGTFLIGLGPLFIVACILLFSHIREMAELPVFPRAWILGWGRVAGLWTLFYYPVALLVGGYSENFKAVINPLLGLDTIRRMGMTFVRLFLMYLVGVMGMIGLGVLTIIANSVLVNYLMGMVLFFGNMVLGCLLGKAIFKCSEKLEIVE